MMTNAIRIAFVVAFVNSILMLFYISGYYPRANVYVSIAALTFFLCAFGIPLMASAAYTTHKSSLLFLVIIAALIFTPTALIISNYYEVLRLRQLILPITAGIAVFFFTFVSPNKRQH